MLTKKADLIKGIDATMEIDMQFLKQMVAEGGDRRLQEECLKCFDS